MILSLWMLACNGGTVTLETDEPLVDTEPEIMDLGTLEGLVFVQSDTVGLASYHFDAGDDVTIDYSNAPNGWHLDDGEPFPAKKPFVDMSFDGDLTFRGTIDWSEPEGSTVDGNQTWVYTMIFDEDFETIESGNLLTFDSDGGQTGDLAFGVDLIYARYDD